MEAKDFFHQVQRAEEELKLLGAQIRHFEDIGFSLSGGNFSAPVVSRSRSVSRVEAAAIGLYDATKQLEDQAREYLAIVNKAKRVISAMPHERYQKILRYRYLSGWSYRSISDELGYTDANSIYRAHGWALQEAQQVLDKMKKEKAGE